MQLVNYLQKEPKNIISEQKVLFSFYVLHILEFSPKYNEMKQHSTLN